MKNLGLRATLSSERGGALFKLIAFLVIFGGVIAAAWIFFLPSLLASALEKRTGFSVKVTQLAINPFQSRVDFQGLVVGNPYTFPRDEFVSVRSFHADAELSTLFSDHPVLNYAQIDVAYVALVRSTDGTTNAVLFQERMLATKEKAKDEPPKKGLGKADGKPLRIEKKEAELPPELPMKFLIKRLELKVDKLIVADFYGRKTSSREFDLKFEHTYENVTDAKQLLNPTAVRGLSSVGAAISGLIPGDLGKIMGAATKSDEFLKETGKKAGDSAKSVIQTLEESRKP